MSQSRNSRSFLSSIFFKSALIVTLSSALLVVTLSFFEFRGTYNLTLQLLRDQGAGTAAIVAKQINAAVRFDNAEQVEKILSAVVDDPSNPADGVLVVDAFHETMYKYHIKLSVPGSHAQDDLTEMERLAKETDSNEMQITRVPDGWVVAVPLLNPADNKRLGVFVSSWSNEASLAALYKSLILTGVISVGLLIAVSAAAALFFRRGISAPLTRVEAAMVNVSNGDYAAEVPELSRRDEIGAIAASLENFRDSLAASEAATREGLFRGAAYSAASASLMLMDNDLNIIATNPSLQSMMVANIEDFRIVRRDFDPAKLVGQNFAIFHGQDTKHFKQMKAESMPIRTEFQIGRGYYDLNMDVIRDAENQPIGFVIEWKNITAERRNAALIGVVDATQVRAEFLPDGTFDAGNAPFCDLFNCSERELMGRGMGSHLQFGDGSTDIFSTLRQGNELRGKFTVRSSSGMEALIEGAMAPVRDRSGNVLRVIALGTDITEVEAREARNREERAAIEAAQRSVVESLRDALSRLSQGDLTAIIEKMFEPEYEQLRSDFNSATQNLHAAMSRVVENAEAIRSEANEISTASDDLSRRTEQQAATLEETAAALNELTVSVQSAAEVAVQANEMVAKAKINAETSGAVVREAVLAMGEIEESSGKISKITSVIDEIAFQTNLLALNAGVEAARAGEAGRGFAVVASEVRALAQRSSDAAREIAGLISSSSNQVKRGVGLVGQAGDALRGIESSVGDIYSFVSEIAVSAREQSTGLGEINTAVNQLDQVTQQNAAMFEETTAASHSLTREAQSLSETMGHFTLANGASSGAVHAPAASSFKTTRSAEPAAETKPAASARRLTVQAMKPATQEEDWEDF